MEHYYLLNGTVMKGGEMPENKGFNSGVGYESHYKVWLSSLQSCEIDESELDKIEIHLVPHDRVEISFSNPIDITDIVDERTITCDKCINLQGMFFNPDCCQNVCLKIYFKQPTEKQVESECESVYTEKQVDELIETICDRLRSGFFKSLELKKMSIDRIKNEDYKHWKKETFQKQFNIGSVEFCNWVNSNGWKRHTPNSKGWNYIQFIFDESIIKSDLELYEIFKNR